MKKIDFEILGVLIISIVLLILLNYIKYKACIGVFDDSWYCFLQQVGL